MGQNKDIDLAMKKQITGLMFSFFDITLKPYHEWPAWAHLPMILLSFQNIFSPTPASSLCSKYRPFLPSFFLTNKSAYACAFVARLESHWRLPVFAWSWRNLLCESTQISRETIKKNFMLMCIKNIWLCRWTNFGTVVFFS